MKDNNIKKEEVLKNYEKELKLLYKKQEWIKKYEAFSHHPVTVIISATLISSFIIICVWLARYLYTDLFLISYVLKIDKLSIAYLLILNFFIICINHYFTYFTNKEKYLWVYIIIIFIISIMVFISIAVSIKAIK